MKKRLLTILATAVLLTWSTAPANAADCVAKVVAKLSTGAIEDVDVVVKFAASIDESSDAARGLLAAIDARNAYGDGALRTRQIIDYFVNAPPAALFEQLSKVEHVARFDEFVLNLSKSDTDAKGAAAVLYYITNKMNPSQVAAFEIPIPESLRRPDVQDVAGNLMECKAHDWDVLSSFIAELTFKDILKQAEVFQQFAAANNTNFVLLLANPIPPQHQAKFAQVFGPLLQLPNVQLVNGF